MMMQARSFVVVIFFFFNTLVAGFGHGTLVKTVSGYQAIESLKRSDALVEEANRGTVVDKKFRKEQHSICLVIDDEKIIVSKNQRFYLPLEYSWREAYRLKPGQELLTLNKSSVKIQDVYLIEKEIELVDISVEPHHIYYVSRKDIMVHNAAPFVVIGVAWAFGEGIKFLGASVSVAAFGTWLGVTWHKHKKNKEKLEFSVNGIGGACGGSDPEDPNDPYGRKNGRPRFENSNQYPNGRYEDVSYHTRNGSGRKSPRPRDGQKALDGSVIFKTTSTARVGISSGEFVVLSQTQKGLYHGHIRSWKDLEPEMRNALQDAGYANAKGKIIRMDLQ